MITLSLPPIQFSSVAQSCPTLCDPMNCSTPGLPVHHQLPEFTETQVHRVSDAISHLILCRPLLLLPPIPLSIRVFSNESALCMRWPKYWNFSFSISPSSKHPGLISFRMDWLDLLAVQGTLKSLLQHHSSKASIPYCTENITQNVGKNGPGNRGHIEEKGTVSSKRKSQVYNKQPIKPRVERWCLESTKRN